MLTQQRLRELVDYNPETGVFLWRSNTSKYPAQSLKREGKLASTVNGHGYNLLYLDGEKFYASRLAWLYMTGRWPDAYIDHENQARADDRWVNLREATPSDNSQNRKLPSNNTSGCRGVIPQNGGWIVRVTVRGKVHYGGTFRNFDDAVIAREAMAIRLHGEFVQLDSLPQSNPN